MDTPEHPIQPLHSNSNIAIRVIVIVAIILIAGGALAYSIIGTASKKKLATSSVTAAATSTPLSAEHAAELATTTSTLPITYKDGTYTATGSYLSPGGDEKIGVKLTLASDIVTALTVTPEPVSPEGKRYQALFVAGINAQVIGQNISNLGVVHVSGSSLTPSGFENALGQIETQAKA